MLHRTSAVALIAALILAPLSLPASAVEPTVPPWLEPYREPASRLIGAALADSFAWHRLAELTDTIGHRLSGSPELERAIAWAVDEMKRDGLENVQTEKVMVPQLGARPRERRDRRAGARTRSRCSASATASARRPSGIAGRSAGRPQLRRARRAVGARAKAASSCSTCRSPRYDETVPFRVAGASRAARHGAVARPRPVDRPARTAPAAHRRPAVRRGRAEDSRRGDRQRGRRSAAAHERPRRPHRRAAADGGALRSPTSSRPTSIGELRGRERPDEVVVVGGHLDSWDVGAGASDDGGGCIVTWEALRLMKKLGPAAAAHGPRRAVDQRRERRARRPRLPRRAPRRAAASMSMMLESDIGVFRPTRLRLQRQPTARARRSRAIATLLDGIGAISIGAGRRRRRHRAERQEAAAFRRCRSRSTGRYFADPPHPGRHRRQDRSASSWPSARPPSRS